MVEERKNVVMMADEEKQNVYILRVRYAGTDWKEI